MAVDDRFPTHRKVLRLRRTGSFDAAVALWLLAGTWACGDPKAVWTGTVPIDVLTTLGVTDWQAAVDALVAVDLWTSDGENIRFHDWDDWNGIGGKEYRAKENARQRQISRRIRQCKAGTHDRHCPTVDGDGNPWTCPKRAEREAKKAAREAGNSGSRDPGTGRDGTGTGNQVPTTSTPAVKEPTTSSTPANFDPWSAPAGAQ